MNDLRGALEGLSPETTVELSYMSSESMGHVLARVPAGELRQALSAPVGDEGRRAVVLTALKDAIGAQAARGGYSRAWDRNVFIACADATFRLDTGPLADAILAALSQPSPGGGGYGEPGARREFADLRQALMSAQVLDDGDEFPNYAAWPIELPAGHWRAIRAALPPLAGEEKGRRADKDALASASARTVEPTSSGSEGGGE